MDVQADLSLLPDSTQPYSFLDINIIVNKCARSLDVKTFNIPYAGVCTEEGKFTKRYAIFSLCMQWTRLIIL